MFFQHKKHLTQRNMYTQTARILFYRPTFLQANILPKTIFTQHVSCAQMPLKTHKKSTAVFTDRRFVHTESSPHRSLTHRKFYAQHCTTFFCIQMLLRGCLYTDTNCTQKLVHTARIYKQPPFTQRGFASPS